MNEKISIERMERALITAAYLVTRYGPAAAPLLEFAEELLEKARRDDPVDKARRILAQYNSKAADAEVEEERRKRSDQKG